jgi:hypothetical protein
VAFILYPFLIVARNALDMCITLCRKNMSMLTHFTDYEVEAGGLSVMQDELMNDSEDEEDGASAHRESRRPNSEEEDNSLEEEDRAPLSRLGEAKDYDPLAFSPEELIAVDEDVEGDNDVLEQELEGEAADAIGEYKVCCVIIMMRHDLPSSLSKYT